MRRLSRALTAALASGCLLVGLCAGAARPAAANVSISFQGGGHGHGVGMQQYGAWGLASQGKGYPEILQTYYTGISLGTAPALPDVRIGLTTAAAGYGVTAVTLTANQTVTLTNGRGGPVVGTVPAGGAVTVRSGAGGVTAGTLGPFASLGAVYPNQDPANRPTTPPVRIAPVTSVPSGVGLGWGDLLFSSSASGHLRSVLQLSEQQALWGLAEMPSSWDVEALRTQVVAARSFLMAKVALNPAQTSAACDCVVQSNIDIAYGGWSKEVEGADQVFGKRWTQAVDSTSRVLAVHEGKAILALFSASSGGHTEDNKNVFGADLPYLKGVPDPADALKSPHHRWSRTYAASDLQAWLGYPGTLTSVQVVGPFGVSGRPLATAQSVVLNGSAGTVTMTIGTLKSRVNAHNPSLSTRLLDTLISTNGFLAFDPAFTGGVSVAVGRVGAGGAGAIVAAADAGGGPHVKRFTAAGTALGGGFFAYPSGFTGGVRVAACRLTPGSTVDDIVTAPGPGSTPTVKVFAADTQGTAPAPKAAFLAFDAGFAAGAYIACSDLDRDGVDEIIVGAGPGAGPNVRVFGPTGQLKASFWAYDPAFVGGVRVAGGYVGGATQPGYVVVTPGQGGGPNVRVITPGGTVVSSFWAFDPSFTGGVWIASGDAVGADGRHEIIVGRGDTGASDVRVVDAGGRDQRPPLRAFSTLDDHGARVAFGPLGSTPLVVGAGRGSAPRVRTLTP